MSGSGDRRGHAKPLREFDAEAMGERGLRSVVPHHAPQAELAAIHGRQHDVGA